MDEVKFGAKLNIIPEFCEFADYKAVKRIVKECEELGVTYFMPSMRTLNEDKRLFAKRVIKVLK